MIYMVADKEGGVETPVCRPFGLEGSVHVKVLLYFYHTQIIVDGVDTDDKVTINYIINNK